MDVIVAAIAWPGALLILGIVILFLFKTEIGALIARTRKVGKSGLETFDAQQPQGPDEKKGVDEFFREFDNPMIRESEKLILKGLADRKIETPVDREKTLLRALAATSMVLHFERVHGLIWASQLTVLRFLNTRTDGATVEELQAIYDAAKAENPQWFENQTRDRWLGFLVSHNLVATKDSRFHVSVAWREFLKYLVAAGKPGPFYG